MPLQLNHAYTHTGSSFSHAFLVAQESRFKKKLVVVESFQEALKMEEICKVFPQSQARFISSPTDFFFFLDSTEGVFICTPDIFFWDFGREDRNIPHHAITLEVGQPLLPKMLVETLEKMGYQFSRNIWEEGVFYVEGETFHIHPLKSEQIFLINIFEDLVDAIVATNEDKSSFKNIEALKILGKIEKTALQFYEKWSLAHFKDTLETTLVYLIQLDFLEKLESLSAALPHFINFRHIKTEYTSPLGIKNIVFEDLDELKSIFANKKNHIICYTKNSPALKEFLASQKRESVEIISTNNRHLKSFCQDNLYVLADDIFGKMFVKRRFKKTNMGQTNARLSIKPGNMVVHADHGVGIFLQILKREFNGVVREYIEVQYAEGDKLFVPIEESGKLSKYIGPDNPKLTRLHSAEWKKVLAKTEAEVQKTAQELLELYAQRNLSGGYAFLAFKEKERQFLEEFPYPHTQDQEQAICEILADMEKPDPMDRLLMGDVGFGKTEVAMHGAYRAFLNKKQSVYIAPLVTLAYEHFETFSRRLAPFGVRVAILTRFSTSKEQKIVMDGLRDGSIDCVIGTHRLLSEDIHFRRLGFLIIDEEHKFGVLDKEKINKMKSSIDILNMSATPIPRSLNMALGGVKKMSLLHTPPIGKKAISTFLIRFDESVIRQAIERELNCGWQVIFIHNRVSTLEHTKKILEKLYPTKLRIATIHGKMPGDTIEDTIFAFKRQEYDILLSTTVIENGMNFLSSNTIFIDQCETFGLSQLHQIRGRVGRGNQEAFCYLIYRSTELPEDAKKRLTTIMNYNEPGSWFEIAMHDLEIRWAGEVLGVAQSGKTHLVGISLYLQMLESKVHELKNEKPAGRPSCVLELSLPYAISDKLFTSESEKISFFQQLESVEDEHDVDFIRQTFVAEQEQLSESVENIFLCLRARIKLGRYGIERLKKSGEYYLLEFDKTTTLTKITALLEHIHNDASFSSAHRVRFPWKKWLSDAQFLHYLDKSIPDIDSPL